MFIGAQPDQKTMAEKILIADDDEVVRSILTAMLDSLGYEVVSVTNGRDCIDFFKDNSADVLFLDYLLDDMSGGDVIAGLQSVDTGNLRIVITTGNSRDEIQDLDPETEIEFFLGKPFDLQALKRIIEEIDSSRN